MRGHRPSLLACSKAKGDAALGIAVMKCVLLVLVAKRYRQYYTKNSIFRASRQSGTKTSRSAIHRAPLTAPRVAMLPRVEIFCNQDPLHLAGAFADLVDLDVAPVARDGKIVHETIAAVDLHSLVGGSLRGFRGEELGHCSFFAEWLALHVQPGGFVIHQARQFDFHRHVGELELDGLEAADRLAELFALFRVVQRFIQ